MAAYYNEFDPNAAAWLRQLIKQGLIADGDVDDRSIVDVRPEDIRGYEQCHFFAGIGGWSYALRLAGVSDSEPLWTASLPCQPFSTAGKQLGKSDERHLLPHFIELVRQCSPNRIFGEQVPGAIRHGWLDDLYTEMEQENYAVGACVLTAAGAGAYHIRQRLYWMANANSKRCDWEPVLLRQEQDKALQVTRGSANDGLAYSMRIRQQGQGELGQSLHTAQSGDREVDRAINVSDISNRTKVSGMGDTEHNGRITSEKSKGNGETIHNSETWENSTRESTGASTPRIISEWSSPDWIYCRDNKYRPIKSSSIKMAHGVSREMVCCCNTSSQTGGTQKEIEVIYGDASEKDTAKKLRVLPDTTRAETDEWTTRGFDCFQKPEVLRSRLHGESLRRGYENRNIEKLPQAIKKDGEVLLRGVWKNPLTSCS